MADFDLLGDGLRKVLLAGIGALATGYEKSSELVDELVKKGDYGRAGQGAEHRAQAQGERDGG